MNALSRILGLALARLALRLLGPEWQLVPVEPTSKMLQAAAKPITDDDRGGAEWITNSTKHRLRWRRMLAVAPQIRRAEPASARTICAGPRAR